MARSHLFEFEDQPWFPDLIRTAMTAYMRVVADFGGHAARVAPILQRAIDRSGATEIVDLGSGGGGPTVGSFHLLHRRRPDLRLTLTDLHPNIGSLGRAADALPDAIRVADSPVDATAVPATLKGLRTLMNVLHHLRPAQAQAVLGSAVQARQPIVVVELLRRHPLAILACCLSFVPLLLSIPFLRPFRWSWLLWSYLVPVIPLAGVWDGVVSSLRIYSEEELRGLVASLEGSDSYDWEFGALDLAPSPVPGNYLIGTPRLAR